MSKTLEPSAWNRVRDLQVKLGPVAATVDFDAGTRPEEAIVLVAEVEHAIRRRFGVRDLKDPDLRVGHWFEVTGQPMVYGVPFGAVGGVLFLGLAGSAGSMGGRDTGRRRFALGGSSEYLLDRGVADGRSPGDRSPSIGSLPLGVYRMLRAFADGSFEDEGGLADFGAINFDDLASRVSGGGVPMTALARCLEIVTSEDPPVVVGTPLYVAFHAPN